MKEKQDEKLKKEKAIDNVYRPENNRVVIDVNRRPVFDININLNNQNKDTFNRDVDKQIDVGNQTTVSKHITKINNTIMGILDKKVVSKNKITQNVSFNIPIGNALDLPIFQSKKDDEGGWIYNKVQ